MAFIDPFERARQRAVIKQEGATIENPFSYDTPQGPSNGPNPAQDESSGLGDYFTIDQPLDSKESLLAAIEKLVGKGVGIGPTDKFNLLNRIKSQYGDQAMQDKNVAKLLESYDNYIANNKLDIGKESAMAKNKAKKSLAYLMGS